MIKNIGKLDGISHFASIGEQYIDYISPIPKIMEEISATAITNSSCVVC